MDKETNLETSVSLQHNLQEMQRALSQLRQQETPKPRYSPVDPAACQHSSRSEERQELLDRMADHISFFAGFRRDDSLIKKLATRFSSLNDADLERRVREIIRQPDDHHQLRKLIEELTVHETYFYRDGKQFDLLRALILPAMIEREKERSNPLIRIWSAATSTGEEAYTLLIITLLALKEAGEARVNPQNELEPNPRWQIDLLGTDISNRILDRARQGIFQEVGSLGSFREMPDEFMPFFEFDIPMPSWGASGLRHGRIKPCYARIPRFEYHNLALGIPIEEGFDIILCRNVMIYFNDHVRRKVLEMHWRALKPGGILLLGPPDPMPLEQRFETCWQDGIVYYLKK